MKGKVIQAVSYYLIWFIGICLASKRSAWLIPMILFLLIQAYFFCKNKITQHQKSAAIILAISGFLIDTIINYFGLIKFNGAAVWIFAPYWLLIIWFSLIMTFLYVLHHHIYKAMLWSSLSIFFFPLTYYSGCKMGAGSWVYPIGTSMAYAIFGGVYFIYLKFILRYLNKQSQ